MLALAVYEDRISSLFDNSSELLLASIEKGQPVLHERINITAGCTAKLLEEINSAGVRILICGAISGCLQNMLESWGIEVLAWISGPVEQVLEVYSGGYLDILVMPGCPSCRRKQHHLKRNRCKTSAFVYSGKEE